MNLFTKENIEKLDNTCSQIQSIIRENVDGQLMIVQLMFLGEKIKDFISNPIVAASGILPFEDDRTAEDIELDSWNDREAEDFDAFESTL